MGVPDHGSFYWHFANRDALVEAMLARWESRHTSEVIAEVSSVPDRVTAQRIAYIASVLRSSGFADEEAARRAQLAYTAYLGHLQLRHTAPGRIIDDAAYRELVLAALLTEESA
ncbi:hypothetical protein [Cryptosporangium sp. NPDC051539]|uniref:hypothetical protein n=1 Tax=Cryptosporangium sp. NPDC051539 TaxID=3363962 RepID=UPI00379D364C